MGYTSCPPASVNVQKPAREIAPILPSSMTAIFEMSMSVGDRSIQRSATCGWFDRTMPNPRSGVGHDATM